MLFSFLGAKLILLNGSGEGPAFKTYIYSNQVRHYKGRN
jgi:hypothetical protein